MNTHLDFILSPINHILEDAAAATIGIGTGIELYPLYDYIMQALFLKMTGFQEQKLKCISWDLATNNYAYRQEKYSKKNGIGEYSSYKDKNEIYKDLIKLIKDKCCNFNITTFLNKEQILKETFTILEETFEKTNLRVWSHSDYLTFIHDNDIIKISDFACQKNELFSNNGQKLYHQLYRHRNRCAHNTLSYQQNLPTLKTLIHPDFRYDNYFVRFSLLIIIDKIFTNLYIKYIETLEEYV